MNMLMSVDNTVKQNIYFDYSQIGRKLYSEETYISEPYLE